MNNPDPISSLDDYLSDSTDLAGLEQEHFKITDDGAASWAMRKLRHIRRQQQSIDATRQQEVDRIDEWHRSATAPLEQSATYFESILSHYALLCREDPDDGRKSISLPYGKVSTRNASPKWTVDAEEFLPWATVNRPHLVRTKIEPSMSAIKEDFPGFPVIDGESALITEDGEVVPGIVIFTPEEASVTIKPDLD